jgi:hypothetical protein
VSDQDNQALGPQPGDPAPVTTPTAATPVVPSQPGSPDAAAPAPSAVPEAAPAAPEAAPAAPPALAAAPPEGVPAPATFEPAPVPPAPPVPTTRSSVKIIGAVGAVVLVIIIAAAVFLLRGGLDGSSPANAQPGDCIGNAPAVAEGEDKEANEAKIVDCASSDATYKVEGRLEDKTAAEAKADDICSGFPSAETSYREIPDGGKGLVLCLSPIG